MHKYTVLIVEDEKNINEFISKTLVSNGYRTNWAASGKEAVSLATSLCPDVILLDLGLPDIDGMEVIRQVRDWSRCPILVISARTEEEDKVNALDAGADDYLTKPFGTSELLARIRTSLRHSAQNSSSPQQLYQAKGLEIDFLRRIVSLNGQPVHLTPIENCGAPGTEFRPGRDLYRRHQQRMGPLCGKRQQNPAGKYGKHPPEAGGKPCTAGIYIYGSRHWLSDDR